MDFVGFLLLAVAAAAIAYAARRLNAERRERLLVWATARGLSAMRRRDDGWHVRYPGLPVFEKGRSRRSEFMIAGAISGHDVRCLDYRYVTGSGKNRRTHHHGVVILEAGTPLIPLRIRPENILDSVAGALGFDDIDFESDAFSRRWHVTSPDRRWAFDVIHPQTMEYLLAAPGATIEFGVTAIAIISNSWLDEDHCEQGLTMARDLFDLLPADVLARLRGETS
jgi:hypothetical protein